MAKGANPLEAVRAAPSAKSLVPVVTALAPLRRIVKPKFYGIEHVPKGGALLVGNHNLYSVFDLTFLAAELVERGIVVRGLADHALFRIPVIHELLIACGVVPGTRANMRELMRRGDLIMVFPGGAREAAKRKGERYQLIWENRLGFAVMAIEGRYPIVPFASMGIEDALDIVLDTDTRLMAPARYLFKKLLNIEALPIVRGIGLTPIPRPERLYFWFGESIPTLQYGGIANEDSAREVRTRTAASIEGGLNFLFDEREKDPERSLLKRLSPWGLLGELIGEGRMASLGLSPSPRTPVPTPRDVWVAEHGAYSGAFSAPGLGKPESGESDFPPA